MKNPVTIQKRLYTLPEAAFYLGCSVYSVRSMIWQGLLPAVKKSEKHGAKIWIDINDMSHFIQQNKTIQRS